MIDAILNPDEVELYVQSLKKTDINDIGRPYWFENQQKLEKLRQQCLFEASHCVHERVKDVILNYEKLPILVFEAICIQIWREKVMKKIFMDSENELKHGFVGYMIMYHECIALNFLQILLHHRDAVQAITDEALDLIDYCGTECVRLCTIKNENNAENNCEDKNELQRLQTSENEMAINRGIASLAIVASFSEYLDDLSISCIDRLYNTHDFPLLVTHLLEVQPWNRVNPKTNKKEVYSEGQWSLKTSEGLCKSEAQCWFILRGLLLHQAAKQHYNLSEYRKQKIMSVQKYLHEHVIDQISPLLELRQFLTQMSVWDPPKVTKSPLLMETVPEIRNFLLAQGSKWKKLRERMSDLLFDGNKEEVMKIAQMMSETYDSAILAQEAENQNQIGKCQLCGNTATKKCSQCHCAWYCSRECQVKSWKSHKSQCEQLKTNQV